jgi:hypothetical protein
MKTTKKWNKIFLTGMAAKAALAATLAFGLIFIGCGGGDPDPDPVPVYEGSSVTYAGGGGDSGESKIVITITTAVDGTKTYEIIYDGVLISRGSVVIDDSNSTMTFTSDSDEKQTFEAGVNGGIPNFSNGIPKDGGGTVAVDDIPQLEKKSETLVLSPEKWDNGGGDNYGVLDGKFDEKITGGVSYKVHLVGKSDKAIPQLYIAFRNYTLHWEAEGFRLADDTLAKESIPANTTFDITTYVTATGTSNSDPSVPGSNLVLIMATDNWRPVDPNSPVILTLTTFEVTKQP